MQSISFIVLVGSNDIYRRCFLSSPLFRRQHGNHEFQLLAQSGFKTASQAFNDAIDKANNDLVVCVHQDVILPQAWAKSFCTKWSELERRDVPLGVVGCWGITSQGERAGHIYHRDRKMRPRRSGDNGNRGPMSLPARIQTLDECLISFHKSSGLRFDPELPSFFGYAVDLCLQAESRGFQNFAVDCPCIHQTADQRRIRKELFRSASYLIKKWKRLLPIATPTGPLESTSALWRDRLKLQIADMIGYSPSRMWWEELPQVDVADILSAETLPTE